MHREEPKSVHRQERPEATFIRTSSASAVSHDEQRGGVHLVIRIEHGFETFVEGTSMHIIDSVRAARRKRAVHSRGQPMQRIP
jgi:hypothetical protein